MVYVVKTVPVEELRKRIENGKKLSKESVINESESKVTSVTYHTKANVMPISGLQSSGSRHCGYIYSSLSEVSLVHSENGLAMPLNSMPA
jgi:uncharacterized pyridoxal phosphate-containing UPF0001 family protein